MKHQRVVWLAVVMLLIAGAWLGYEWLYRDRAGDDLALDLTLKIEGQKTQAELQRNADGTYTITVQGPDGSMKSLTPDQFADLLFARELDGSFLSRLFNISTPYGVIWVSIGLLGQLMFTGRMLVQWLTSEKYGRSVVPTAFWWLSVGGALMLLAYFSWRQDLVGVLGQGAGLAIYLRNIYLIHQSKPGLPQTDTDHL